MKKRVQAVIRQTVQQSLIDYAFRTVQFLTLCAMFLLLYFNIVASQLIPPLYFTLFEDKKATAGFLQAIQSLPEFDEYFAMAKVMYGQSLEDEVYQEARERRQKIDRLEALLQRNAKARDVLYSLSLLYRAEGDRERAEDYLRRAREVDPMIGR